MKVHAGGLAKDITRYNDWLQENPLRYAEPRQPAMKKFATITVIGKDKTGVIAKITNFLFLQEANIEALEEQVTRGQFSMTVQASWRDSELDRDAIVSG